MVNKRYLQRGMHVNKNDHMSMRAQMTDTRILDSNIQIIDDMHMNTHTPKYDLRRTLPC